MLSNRNELISAALQGDPEDAVPIEFLEHPYGDEESKEDYHQHFSFSNNLYPDDEEDDLEETVSPRALPPNPEEDALQPVLSSKRGQESGLFNFLSNEKKGDISRGLLMKPTALLST